MSPPSKRLVATTPSISNKKNLKQGNLFSFFGKKPPSTLATPSPSGPKSTSDTITNKTADTASISTVSSRSTQGNDTLQPTPLWHQVQIGSRIAVYWPDDKAYYNATVTGQRGKSSSAFTLSYDDGEVERVDLATERFRILTSDKDSKEDSTKETTNTTPPHKKRRIEESDEEEAEFDDMEDESSKISEGSAYRDDPHLAHEEDDDDQWMVTDDEEESPQPKKASTKKPRLLVTQVVLPSSKLSYPTPARTNRTPSVSPPAKKTSPERQPTPSTAKPIGGAPLPFIKGVLNPAGSHFHNHLKFLQKPKDIHGRCPDDPLYDAHTLHVDYRELEADQKITPASRQWWELKAQYFDTVLLFKTGKFYELFHMDADVGVIVLDFIYMKGHVAHAGFPEISYGIMADKLVRAGYKVARVEQTETPDMLKERKKDKKRGAPAPQVVNREVCSILTLGTRTFCYLDDTKLLSGEDNEAAVGPLLAIREIVLPPSPTPVDDNDDQAVQPVCEYGITIVDAVRGTVTIGQFADDVLRSRMNTLLTAYEPSEILIEGGENGASPTLQSLIRSVQATSRCSAKMERIQPKETFPKSTAVDSDIRRKMERKCPTVQPWDVDETLEELHRRGYYPRASRQQQDRRSTSRWPKVLHAAVEGKADLAMSSFGAVLFYLQRNLIDHDILGMGIVKAYIPPSSSGKTKDCSVQAIKNLVTHQDNEENGIEGDHHPQINSNQSSIEFDICTSIASESEINHMSLDGTTLQNLEVLTNSQTHTPAGSLWSKINYTKTPHGCRLLRAWLLRPLFRKADIERRADAVEELVSGGAAVALSEARGVLAKCGDLERLLSRVHSMGGSAKLTEDGIYHPNDRAVLYETVTHTKRKVGDFSKLLNGLRHTTQIPELFAGINLQSRLLQKIVRPVADGGCFPEMTNELDWFFDNFDCDQAARGLFEPSRGVDETYDEACDTVERIQRELEDYREEMCASELHPKQTAKSQWKYINTKVDSKDKYLIELPASIRVPDDFLIKGKRGSGAKQVNKYRTSVVEQLVQELEQALDIQKEGKSRGMQLVFAKFDTMRNLWAAASQATAMLDALGSLAQAAAKPGYARPTILDCPPEGKPCVHVVQGRHPCVDITHNGGQFIPNDLTLGRGAPNEAQGKASRVLLLSGPNMGGKSTLLRQTCLIAILAQIGCYVPAEECEITPIDRIYTRLGACDRILQGQSTFFVELAETASALRGATRRSLVIMDELGRGTSTFDGTAIASASVKHLVERNQCLTLFATHYHSLLEEWKNEPTVRLGHMECLVEGNDSDSDYPQQDSEPMPDKDADHNITFLYTLGEGACPKSFGINVARLAGLPEEVLSTAKRVSSTFEAEMNGAGDIKSLVQRIKSAIHNGNLDEVHRLWEEGQ